MKILYLSCHSVLSFDEITLFDELGHQVFSPGDRVCDDNVGDPGLRDGIPKCENYDELMEEWHTFGQPGKDNKENISVAFFKKFDLCIVMHLAVPWVSLNWNRIKEAGIPVVLRTIGQNVSHNENQMAPYVVQGLKVVRYSPMEKNIPGYVGEDAMIRFYKDPEEFKDWNGDIEEVAIFGQSLKRRGAFCGFNFLEEITRPFPRAFYGADSEQEPYGKGKVSFSELKAAMRNHRCAAYFGTYPASVVLSFLELCTIGMPIVSVGSKLGNPASFFPGHNLFEIPQIIKHGENGFCSDDVNELQSNIRELLRNKTLAKSISVAARTTAIELFGKEKIKTQWDTFLQSIV